MHKHIIRKSLIAAGLLLAPLSVNAAGLGKLTVTSALGQPLRAEAEILADKKDDLASFVARLASQDAYRDAKVDRATVLTNLKFSIEKKSGGQPFLKITSIQPVNEPFLELLVELNWSTGRLMREYSILLDPPGYSETQPVAPVAVPIVKALPAEPVAPQANAAAAPDAAKPVQAKEETKPVAKAPVKAVKPSKPAKASAAELTPAERTFPDFDKPKPQAAAEQAVRSSETYAVKKGDTLAKIAADVKPEGINLDQMLVGLYQANKQAFAGNNMNRLKTGQILRVPEADKLAATSKAEAANEVKVHTSDWNAYRQKLAAVVASSEPEKEKVPTQTVTGKIGKAEDKAAAKPEPSKDVLKLSKGEAPAGKGAAGAGKDAKGLQDRIHALEEESTAKEKTIKESGSRIAELEKNIKEMQKLLDIKSQSLTDLQKQAAASKAAPAKPAAPLPAAPVVAPAPAAKAPEPATKTMAEAAKPAEVTPEAKKPEEAVAPEAKEAEVKPLIAAEKPVAPPAKPKPVVKHKPVVVTPPKAEPSWYEEYVSNPLYLAAGAGVVLLTGLLGFMAVGSRRKKKLTSFEDSIMTGGDLKPNTIMGDTGGGVIDTGDTSFLTDFSQAGLGTIDTNDVDPIAEAEVYMAYGRDAQAEEILKEAMSKDSGRHEIQLKLLEIYASRKNAATFETLASELYAALGGKSSPIWEKAAEMGRELDPNNPLYAGGYAAHEQSLDVVTETHAEEVAAPVVDNVPEAVAEPAMEELSSLDMQFASGTDMTANTAPDLEFSLDSGTDMLPPEEEEPLVPAASAEAEEGVLDFDLGLPEAEPQTTITELAAVTEEHAEEHAEEAAHEIEDIGLDFDMSSILVQPEQEEVQAASAPVAQPELEPESEEISLEMPMLSLPEEHEHEIELTAPAIEESIELEAPVSESSLDFDFNIEEEPAPQVSKETPAAPPVPELDLAGLSLDLTEAPTIAVNQEEGFTAGGDQWHEVSTKLDLAKAYVEMGDTEGAREILQEVVQDGDEKQQSDAKALLAELG